VIRSGIPGPLADRTTLRIRDDVRSDDPRHSGRIGLPARHYGRDRDWIFADGLVRDRADVAYAYARMNNSLIMPSAANEPPGYALQSGGFTIRQTFVQSDREEKTLFFGFVVRSIFSPPGTLTPDLFVANKQGIGAAQAPRFIQDANPRFAGMLTPIVGVHLPDDYEMIFNANFDFALGSAGSAFEPSIRIVKNVNDKLALGIEHFSNVGPIDHWLPLNQQMQTLYAVADTKFRVWSGVLASATA